MELSAQILSDITVHAKYAKYLEESKRREGWDEIVDRNKQMQLARYPHMARDIDVAYQLVYDKRLLPSMRSMQFAGKAIELNHARGYNCAYFPIDHPRAFSELMFLLLSGCGVGYSVQSRHVSKLPHVKKPDGEQRFVVQDSIIGWAEAVKALANAYLLGKYLPIFEFGDVRPKGARLKTAGGTAPGPDPLRICLEKVWAKLASIKPGSKLLPLHVHDIACAIADCVLAGGIRRSAMISLFDRDDSAMMGAKAGEWWADTPERGRANNSGILRRGEVDEKAFHDIWNGMESSGSGEPGIYWTNNPEWGSNPCVEISLLPHQFCNLVEGNAQLVGSQDDLEEVAYYGSLLATLQAGYTDFHFLRPEWKKATEKEALIGMSWTGIAGSRLQHLDLASAAYVVRDVNADVADRIGINTAARTTCVKPSGTTSLVLGTSSGIHAWHSPHYLRRITLNRSEPLFAHMQTHAPELLEDSRTKEDEAYAVVPMKAPSDAVCRTESPLDLLERVKEVYDRWVVPGHVSGDNTNNISCTVSVKDDEWGEVGRWMWDHHDSYNGLAVLPHDGGTYQQTPFEECTAEEYERRISDLKGLDLSSVREDSDSTTRQGEAACAGGACEV